MGEMGRGYVPFFETVAFSQKMKLNRRSLGVAKY